MASTSAQAPDPSVLEPAGSTSPRVAFVSSHAQLGGSELYLEQLLEHFEPELVGAVVSLQEGPFVERLRARGRSVLVVPTPARIGMLAAALKLRRVLLRERPDLVHANGVKAALVCTAATLGTRIPVVWHKHDLSLDGRLARLIGSRCRAVVGVSRRAVATFGDDPGPRVRVIHVGIVGFDVDRAAGRRALVELARCSSDAPVVVLAGRINPGKGQLELVEAVPALAESHPSARFVLVGSEDPSTPDYAAAVRRRVEELGVAERVRLVGHREDAVELMAGADVLAVPSRNEGFGLVGVEALAVGTPVVAYRSGSLPEVLGDCAALVAEGDVDELREAICRVLDDASLRERMTACGHQRIREQFRIDVSARRHAELYRELVAETASGRG